jgi:hypothetical protein
VEEFSGADERRLEAALQKHGAVPSAAAAADK